MEEIDERKLRKTKESANAIAARIAIDHDNPARALSLIRGSQDFWPQNLITLMTVIGFYSEKRELVTKAYRLFSEQLKLCSKVGGLVQLALWVRNPNRAASIPRQLTEAIDRQRRILEPDWDGQWYDGGIGTSNRSLEILKLQPHQVQSTDDCLTAASQSGNWNSWIQHYYDLGGSTENPRYLKMIVSKSVNKDRAPTDRIKGLLRKFIRLGEISEVRKFLRHITPTHRSLKGINPNREIAEYALLLYCHCQRLEHTIDDWVHIAESALHLDHYVVAKTVQRILVGFEDNLRADEVLRRLTHRHGATRMTLSARDDIGPKGNRIWEDMFMRIPVNADAKKILKSYSDQEIGMD